MIMLVLIENKLPYTELIDTLLYLVVTLRPNRSYAVSCFRQYFFVLERVIRKLLNMY